MATELIRIRFHEARVGDTLRFHTTNKGERTGTVTQITPRTVVVDCAGTKAVLRQYGWGDRKPARVIETPEPTWQERYLLIWMNLEQRSTVLLSTAQHILMSHAENADDTDGLVPQSEDYYRQIVCGYEDAVYGLVQEHGDTVYTTVDYDLLRY